jgi:hypothetical protein
MNECEFTNLLYPTQCINYYTIVYKMSTKKSAVAVKSMPVKVTEPSEEVTEEIDEPMSVKPHNRPGHKLNNMLENLSKCIEPREIDGVPCEVIVITSALKNEIIKTLADFAKGGKSATKVDDDKPKPLHTSHQIMKMCEKNPTFIEEYMKTKEYKELLNSVPLMTTAVEDGKTVTKYNTELSVGWKTEGKMYHNQDRYPKLHEMIKEVYDVENIPRIAAWNTYIETIGQYNEELKKYYKYSNEKKTQYKLWDSETAKWGEPINIANKAVKSAGKTSKTTTRPGVKA